MTRPYRRYATPDDARKARAAYSRAYNRVNKDASRLRAIWSAYRLPAPRYRAMMLAGCGLCGVPEPTDVDHDHGCEHPERGRLCCERCVRGLLCRSCNLRVGACERGLNNDSDVAAYLGRARPGVLAQGLLF